MDDCWSDLERLAKAATAGPWTYEGSGFSDDGGRFREVTASCEVIFGEFGTPSEANSAFIAAANPKAILSLIEVARQAQAETESGK